MVSPDELQQLLAGTGVCLQPPSDDGPVWVFMTLIHALISIGFISFFFITR